MKIKEFTKVLLKIIKITIITAVGFFVSIAILGLVLTANHKEQQSKQTKIPTATTISELLIAPKETVRYLPTETIRHIVPTNTPTPTSTHLPIRGNSNQIPYYSEDGRTILGFINQVTTVPAITQEVVIQQPTFSNRKCTIKGNISWRNNDEKIYHCPNWRDYNRTSVDESNGEKWFCSEQEALAEGYRRPENVGDTPCIID